MAVPARALRLSLAGSDSRTRSGIACLRPARPFAGAQVFPEGAGGARELLLAEGLGPSRGRCVRWGPVSAGPSSCRPPHTPTAPRGLLPL